MKQATPAPKFPKRGTNRNAPYTSPFKKKNNDNQLRNNRQNQQRGGRGGHQSRGNYKNQGGRALQFNKANNDTKRESKAEIVPKYDVNKIPQKLKHFASENSNTPNLKQLLVDQCKTENLIIDLD